MHSVQDVMWDSELPSKHASPLPPQPPSNARPAHVTTTTPAKRITFYKSGDSQFGGVRMAIHKRSFKCFDALLDDLSQKVPLPFGVRTVTTPRGTHTIKHLEQLQDGGCYLCSDRRQAKPIDMELASKRPSIWYHHSHRPHRPDAATPPGHLPYRQRRILLVKNTEPGVKRSVVLSRRSTRSLGAFLEEASGVMQFHVRKLYTAEGRRIDSVQSLMTSPGILVCVGREAFSTMLVDLIRKSSEEKLPGFNRKSPGPRTPGNGARSHGGRSSSHGAQSRASEYSEGQDSKKTLNLGLETRKSIIHPRSSSSNRSTRFSLSSDKSYGNGASSQARAALMNDDIEKRVLVNKDGSLSVEMRVRFRLRSNESLQWSTQINKSPSLTNDCCPLSQAQSHYLHQGRSESCSDRESTSFDPDGLDYSNQGLQHALEGNHCPCCYQGQEEKFDLWENPAHCHKQPPVPPPHTASHTVMRHTHSSSSSSSCNSRRVVRCRARISQCREDSTSEHSQMVQEEIRVTEEVEHRVEVEQDERTHVEVCTVSRCSRKSVEEEEERPLSGVSSSSHVLQSLREDQDDEDDDLPTGDLHCCHSDEASPSTTSQNDQPMSEKENKGYRSVSAASACHCEGNTPQSAEGADEMVRASGSSSKTSRASHRIDEDKILNSEDEAAPEDVNTELKRSMSGVSHTSVQSRVYSVCPNCGGCKLRVTSSCNSSASQRSHRSHRTSPNLSSTLSNHENDNVHSDDDGSSVSRLSTQSNKTNLTNRERLSATSNALEGQGLSAMSSPELARKEEPPNSPSVSHRSRESESSGCKITTGATAEDEDSVQSSRSPKPDCNGTAGSPTGEEAKEEDVVERSVSSLSAKSGISPKSNASVQSDCESDQCLSAVNHRNLSVKANRPNSVKSEKSTKTKASAKSSTSNQSVCSHCATGEEEVSLDATGKDKETEVEERAASIRSAKSNSSIKSGKASQRSVSPRLQARGDGQERAASQMSVGLDRSNATPAEEAEDERVSTAMSGGSKSSMRSSTSRTSNKNVRATSTSQNAITINSPEVFDENGMETDRVPSADSAKSIASSALSQRSSHNGSAGIAIIADAQIGISTEQCNGQTLSPRRTRSPKVPASSRSSPKSPGERRGPSTLSDHSTKSARSKCLCETSSPLHKESENKLEKVDERKVDDKKELKSEEDSEPAVRASSITSTSSKRPGGESRGTKQPLSRSSSGSVSLGLEGEQETGDTDGGSGSVQVHRENQNTKSASTTSERFKMNGSALSPHPPVIDVPMIETTGGDEDGEGQQENQRAFSSKSTRSACNCHIREGDNHLEEPRPSPTRAGNYLETERKGSAPGTKGNSLDAPNNRASSAASSVSRGSKKSTTSHKNTKAVKPSSGHLTNTKVKEDISSSSQTASDHTKSRLSPHSATSAHTKESGNRETAVRGNRSVETPSSDKKKHGTLNKSRRCPVHSSRPSSKAEAECSESSLSHSLSAADLLKEAMAVVRSCSQQSKVSDKPKSQKTQGKSNKKEAAEEIELTPACLPNMSPNEVVSGWLRSIPVNSNMLALGDEVQEAETEEEVKEEAGEEAEKEEESPESRNADKKEEATSEEEEDKEEEMMADPAPGVAARTEGSLSKNWHSSAIMKVLLSSSLGRCRSLPEVSPVYGRRLSSSARGLLDCLAQLQLIEPAVSDHQKERSRQYEDLMTILRSLWLTEPRDIEVKEVCRDQVTPPRSSSGVGMSSGSGGSGKENGEQGGDETLTKEESVHEDETVEKAVEENETIPEQDPRQSDKQSTDPQSLDSHKASENPSSSDQSSPNDSAKSHTDNEREALEDSSSGTPSTVLRAPLSKKLSQEPDPVWVLHLLKKLEKQFINHYINAMAEFKVRWDLDDSLILDTMISELKDEVSRRIQSSIEREMKKIQSRAGRGGRSPRPPQGANLSRESTMTERRRRMLKVMKNQSVKTGDSLSDGEMTADFSDQRSDDEYCPCEACVRKKMATRPLKTNPTAAEAPVMMEFDLLKILQLKKSPSPAAEPQTADRDSGGVVVEEEGRNLEVVQEEEEEEEESKEDKKVELEDTIPEEEEEEIDTGTDNGSGEEKTSEQAGEGEECQCQCDTVGSDEEKEEEEDGEGETTEGEEAQEMRDGVDEGDEDEIGDNVGETDTGEEDETTTGGDGDDDEESEEDDDGKNTEKEESPRVGEAEDEDEESQGEKALTQILGGTPAVCATEGEDADAEDSVTDMSEKCDTRAGNSGRQEAVEEEGNKREDGALFYQVTRTSVESQPGSLEDMDTPPVSDMPPMATGGSSGGAGHRRNRSPARVRRNKPRGSDDELDNF